MKIVGIVKSIIGTDAVIAIDEDGNQRAIFPGDNLYDNEKLLELSGVQVNVEPVTVADAQKKGEPKSDKEVASLQDALLNGKDISELEETAAGNWVAPIKLPVTEAPSAQPGEPTSSDSLVVSPTLALTDITLDSMYADKGVEHLGKHPPLDVNNQMTDFTPTFFGTSEPFANIKVEAYGTAHSWVYSNLDKLVTLYTKADEHGNWQVESDKELGLYKHEVKVSTVDDHGTVLSSLNPVEFWMPERILHDDPYSRL